MIYEFGEFQLDLRQKCLRHSDRTVPIQPKVFDILVVLVVKQGEIVSRDELMKVVWKDTFVEETNLRFCIHTLRKILGKNVDGEEYVETIQKRGYRLAAQIIEKSSEIKIEKVEQESDEIIPKAIQYPQPPKRNWQITIAILSLFSLLVAAFVWQRNAWETPKSNLGFDEIAVLPFESAGENPTDFQIGLADAMITSLSKIKQLKVLPLTSVRHLAGQQFDALQIGKQLGTDAVLSGTYRIDGENVQVSVKLRQAGNGESIWSETFTVRKKSGWEFENSIALRTARLLSLKIAEIEEEKNLSTEKLNPEARQNFLSARKIWRAGELFRRKEMIGRCEKAVEVEPNWALGYAMYAEALLSSDQLSVEWEKAEEMANQALKLNGSLAEPHAFLGEIYHGVIGIGSVQKVNSNKPLL